MDQSYIGKLETIVKAVREWLRTLDEQPLHKFGDYVTGNGRPKRGDDFAFPGVYVLYEGEKVIYVGSAGKGRHHLKFRLADLFYFSSNVNLKDRFKHYLSKKLIEKYHRFDNIDSLRDYYYTKCKFRVIQTPDIQDARIIEAILIKILKPEYNQ